MPQNQFEICCTLTLIRHYLKIYLPWFRLCRKYVSAPMPGLIKALNQVLRGWGNYHRHVVSLAFSRVDTYVYEQLWRMIRRRHQNKPKKWLAKRYWSGPGGRNIFSVKVKTKKENRYYSVIRLCSIGIRRHIKIKAHGILIRKKMATTFGIVAIKRNRAYYLL